MPAVENAATWPHFQPLFLNRRLSSQRMLGSLLNSLQFTVLKGASYLLKSLQFP